MHLMLIFAFQNFCGRFKQLADMLPSLEPTTKHLKVPKYIDSKVPLLGTCFKSKTADDGALHSVRSLRLLICTPHAKRSNGKSMCGRRAYLRSLVCSPFWNDHCDLLGHNQDWLPNYLESKKLTREIHLFTPIFSSLPAEKSKFRGASFGSTISGTPY